VLLDEGTPFCLTLERLWLDNRVGESCIPLGTYTCERTVSRKFGVTFEVTRVPGRSAILFHKGNLMEDSHGCIILGEQYERMEGKTAVLASGKAFEEFLARTAGIEEFELQVEQV
jgi:hypothetical protein